MAIEALALIASLALGVIGGFFAGRKGRKTEYVISDGEVVDVGNHRHRWDTMLADGWHCGICNDRRGK